MEINKTRREDCYGIRFSAKDDGKEIGRAYLYVIYNDLHDEPYGLMEDVFVEEEFRGTGVGTKLVNMLIEEAKEVGCRKLIGQSRHSKPRVHELYKNLGFKDHGLNFRMDFITD